MKGLPDSIARRRAISVLPTPVGPIMRMFLGVISAATGGARRWRRTRLRSAIATARFAAPCPTTQRPSPATISRGLSESRLRRSSRRRGAGGMALERLHLDRVVGVDADLGDDAQGLAREGGGVEVGEADESPGRSEGHRAAAPDGADALLGRGHGRG